MFPVVRFSEKRGGIGGWKLEFLETIKDLLCLMWANHRIFKGVYVETSFLRNFCFSCYLTFTIGLCPDTVSNC